MNKLRFNELHLSGHILSAVAEMGFEEASPIQSETIPIILDGKDVIGQAQTGTGKTAAFAIPAIEKLEPGSRAIQTLVLCPTRELVMQVTEEFRKLMKFMGSVSDASVVAVYGGQEIDRQFKALKKKPLIVVGTPGRMMDHMRRGSISLSTVTMVVLDEADEMLDMGFRDDIEYILAETPSERQTIMFSATMSKDILALTNRYQRDPVVIDVTSQKINAPSIEQMYFELPERAKPEAVARLIDFYDVKLALVFCNTKSKVDSLVEVLKTRGYFAEGLHGDLSQKQREKVMAGFRNGSVEVLVATDVAGRGIDVNDIAAVFNYDLPRDDEDYIHRIGRTGRAGKSGRSFTFVTGREIYNLRRIEKTNGIKITRGNIPSIDDLDSTMARNYTDKIKALVDSGSLSRYVHLVEGIMGDEYTSLDVAAVLLKMAMDGKSEGYDETQVFEIRQDSRREYHKSDSANRGRSRDNRGGRSDRFSGKDCRRGSSDSRGRSPRSGKAGRDRSGESGGIRYGTGLGLGEWEDTHNGDRGGEGGNRKDYSQESRGSRDRGPGERGSRDRGPRERSGISRSSEGRSSDRSGRRERSPEGRGGRSSERGERKERGTAGHHSEGSSDSKPGDKWWSSFTKGSGRDGDKKKKSRKKG